MELTLTELQTIVLAAGFSLVVGLERATDVDRAQIEECLALTPQERLTQLQTAANFVLDGWAAVAEARSAVAIAPPSGRV